MFQQAVEGSVELAATQAKQWDTASASAAELQDSLQSLREQEVHSLLGAFDSINTQIVSHSQMTNENDPNVVQRASNELVAVMYSSQQEMDQVMLLGRV